MWSIFTSVCNLFCLCCGTVELKKQISSSLRLINSSDSYVAFKVGSERCIPDFFFSVLMIWEGFSSLTDFYIRLLSTLSDFATCMGDKGPLLILGFNRCIWKSRFMIIAIYFLYILSWVESFIITCPTVPLVAFPLKWPSMFCRKYDIFLGNAHDIPPVFVS